jgi:hypothetical protein
MLHCNKRTRAVLIKFLSIEREIRAGTPPERRLVIGRLTGRPLTLCLDRNSGPHDIRELDG